MTEARPRRERRARTAPITRLPPRIENPFPPVELFSAEQVARIIAAAHRILAEGGLEIRSARARDHYRRGGAEVDEATMMVRLPADVLAAHLVHAPGEFVLHARNPERHLHVGGRVVNFGPVNGTPHVTDLIGGRRYGTLDDFAAILKVTHALGVLHWQGGVVTEPTDMPVPVRHLEMYRAHIACSDIVWAARGIGSIQAEDALALSAIEHGTTIEGLAARPTLLTVTNVNSPRRVDEEILDNIMAMSGAGQCVVITPFTLMGAMAPVSLPGALAQQTAEALGIIALCQMIRPGAPCVLGGFTSNVDMRTGSPAFGTPEYVHATLGGAQLARALRLPYRASAVCASPAADAQAAYETAFSLWACIMGHANLVMHATGWLEGGLAASFEKVVIDSELLRAWAEMLRVRDVTDDDLAVDAILAVPPGGHFFGEAHTLARYETAFWRPILSDWSNFETWRDAGAKDATQRAHALWHRTLAAYEAPPLDPAIREAVDAFVARRREALGH
jgi:trimethylamine--corrinoid protein Co-methyltransferase